MRRPQIFVDLDGTLADFDSHYEAVTGIRPDKAADNVDWMLIRGTPNFYRDIPPMPDMRELWDFVAPFHPIVLTGIPRQDGPKAIPEAADNKRAWVMDKLGTYVEVRCVRSKEKYLHANPGDILIDDWERYKHLWLKAGGQWITHTSAANSIHELNKLGYGLRGARAVSA